MDISLQLAHCCRTWTISSTSSWTASYLYYIDITQLGPSFINLTGPLLVCVRLSRFIYLCDNRSRVMSHCLARYYNILSTLSRVVDTQDA